MRQMAAPARAPLEVYYECVAEVRDDQLRHHYSANHAGMDQAFQAFDAATATVAWSALPRMARGNTDAVVMGTLSKEQLTDLYSKYMVAASGASRRTYDAILVAADGKCPFCGGIGQVATLDHYLPKSSFPSYSVLPLNLVPCCRDCNSGKNSSFGVHAWEQTLHPYLDDAKFFTERWIHSEVRRSDPIELRYFCSPPVGWAQIDKARVSSHFDNYKLAYRFGVQAGADLARIVDLRKGSLAELSAEKFRDVLLESASSPGFDVNGWSRTMFHALANSDWFCTANLADPQSYVRQ